MNTVNSGKYKMSSAPSIEAGADNIFQKRFCESVVIQVAVVLKLRQLLRFIF